MKQLIASETIAQFKVYQFLEENFNLPVFKLELVDKDGIKIADQNGDSMIFRFVDEKIIEE